MKLDIINRVKNLSFKFYNDKLNFEKEAESFYYSLNDKDKLKVFHYIIKIIYRNKIHLKLEDYNSLIYDLQLNHRDQTKILDSGILEISNSLDFCNNFESLLQQSINELTADEKNNYDILLAKNIIDKMKKIHTSKFIDSHASDK